MKKRVVWIKVIFFCLFSLVTTSSQAFKTLHSGVLTVAVTSVAQEDKASHNNWMYTFFTCFAAKHGIGVDFKVVNFQDSWNLAAQNEVDIVATGVTNLPQRQVEGTEFSKVYTIVKRGIRVWREDADALKTLDDFVGRKIAVVEGMTAETDLRNRAPEGVEIVTVQDWEQLYNLFKSHHVSGIAEGYYIFPGEDMLINDGDPDSTMIDPHDLTEGVVEGLVFVVREDSIGLIEDINAHIESLGLPNKRINNQMPCEEQVIVQ